MNQVPLLEVRRLSLTVGPRLLCRALDFVVEPGQFWCVMGRNGCGKTTLLNALAGLRNHEAGQIALKGRPLADWNWRELAQVRALLPQKLNDVFPSTVLESVLIGRFPHQGAAWQRQLGFDDRYDQNIALDCLQELGISALAARNVLTLSGGERQRVAVATLLAQAPQLALLDEPVAHLDLDVQRIVLDVLARHAAHGSQPGRPCSAIVTLHDVNLAERYASHVLLFLDDGAVLAGPKSAVITTENLSRAYRHPVREISDGAGRWFVPS
jgi:iron complex transport system ATP-binding protein